MFLLLLFLIFFASGCAQAGVGREVIERETGPFGAFCQFHCCSGTPKPSLHFTRENRKVVTRKWRGVCVRCRLQVRKSVRKSDGFRLKSTAQSIPHTVGDGGYKTGPDRPHRSEAPPPPAPRTQLCCADAQLFRCEEHITTAWRR